MGSPVVLQQPNINPWGAVMTALGAFGQQQKSNKDQAQEVQHRAGRDAATDAAEAARQALQNRQMTATEGQQKTQAQQWAEDHKLAVNQDTRATGAQAHSQKIQDAQLQIQKLTEQDRHAMAIIDQRLAANTYKDNVSRSHDQALQASLATRINRVQASVSEKTGIPMAMLQLTGASLANDATRVGMDATRAGIDATRAGTASTQERTSESAALFPWMQMDEKNKATGSGPYAPGARSRSGKPALDFFDPGSQTGKNIAQDYANHSKAYEKWASSDAGRMALLKAQHTKDPAEKTSILQGAGMPPQYMAPGDFQAKIESFSQDPAARKKAIKDLESAPNLSPLQKLMAKKYLTQPPAPAGGGGSAATGPFPEFPG